MPGNEHAGFDDLSDFFLNEDITPMFTRRRLLSQIRESIVSPVVKHSADNAYEKFVGLYGKGGFKKSDTTEKTIKVELGETTVPINFYIYNAASEDELEKNMPEAFTGNSTFRHDGKLVFVNVRVGLIKGKTTNANLRRVHGILQHELNHIHQQFCRGREYGHAGLNSAAISNLISDKEEEYVLGTIAYIGNYSERQGFCNELYVDSMDCLRGCVVPDCAKQSAYIWLNNLQKAYQYLLKNKDSLKLADAIDRFKDSKNLWLYSIDSKDNLEKTGRTHLSDEGKWTYHKFKTLANNTIHKFEDEIRHTIGKVVMDATEEGIMPRITDADIWSMFFVK